MLVVEDAITTGGSLAETVDAVEATGAKLLQSQRLLIEEIARPLIESREILYYPLATYLDLGIDPVEIPS